MPISYEIHPAIGIARLGSSPLATEEGYFIGPEPGVSPPTHFRDSRGYLKRQGARFRIFACERNEQNRLERATELTLANARLTWTVHLVNRKAAAWRRGFGHGHRNFASGNDLTDQSLIINAGLRSVVSPGEHQIFDTGKFRTTSVKLGEIVMEPNGRLLVLGGHGRSGSDPPQPRLTIDRGYFASNDNWFDDTADGPVTVTIELANGTRAVAGAWVVVGPPDFAPGIVNFVTLYDVLVDRAIARRLPGASIVEAKELVQNNCSLLSWIILVIRAISRATRNSYFGPVPKPLYFTRHIQPILARALGYQWVNRQAAFGFDGNGRGHGPGGTADFSRTWKLLSDPTSATQRLRSSIVGRLRNPDHLGPKPALGLLVAEAEQWGDHQ